MRKIGVYLITNTANGKVYVGSSTVLDRRLYEHRRALTKNTHKNRHLQSAWNAVGGLGFTFEIVAKFAAVADALACEKTLIDERRSGDRECGYNISVNPDNSKLGIVLTPEQCERVGIAKRGNSFRRGAIIPQEMRDRISLKLRGRRLSVETRAKMSAARLGVPKSAEWARKIQESRRATRAARKAAGLPQFITRSE